MAVFKVCFLAEIDASFFFVIKAYCLSICLVRNNRAIALTVVVCMRLCNTLGKPIVC